MIRAKVHGNPAIGVKLFSCKTLRHGPRPLVSRQGTEVVAPAP